MKPIKDVITIEELEGLASRSNFRLGKSIAEQGEFVIEKENTYNIIAKISHKNKGPRVAKLESTPKGLRWQCSCNSRKGMFCEHCVALGMFLLLA